VRAVEFACATSNGRDGATSPGAMSERPDERPEGARVP
jgi:hypothetical protein